MLGLQRLVYRGASRDQDGRRRGDLGVVGALRVSKRFSWSTKSFSEEADDESGVHSRESSLSRASHFQIVLPSSSSRVSVSAMRTPRSRVGHLGFSYLPSFLPSLLLSCHGPSSRCTSFLPSSLFLSLPLPPPFFPKSPFAKPSPISYCIFVSLSFSLCLPVFLILSFHSSFPPVFPFFFVLSICLPALLFFLSVSHIFFLPFCFPSFFILFLFFYFCLISVFLFLFSNRGSYNRASLSSLSRVNLRTMNRTPHGPLIRLFLSNQRRVGASRKALLPV